MNLASDCFGLVATHLAIFLISGPYLPLTIMCPASPLAWISVLHCLRPPLTGPDTSLVITHF